MVETRIGGIVLCGGHSVRMGQPKAWLPVGDETLLQRTVRVVGQVCAVTVAVGRNGQALPSLPDSIEIVSDEFLESGPVAGIEAGLRKLRDRCQVALVTACDHPQLNAKVVVRLLEAAGDHCALIVEHGGRTCPLLGVYRTDLADRAKAFLERGERAARRFAEECQAVVISSASFRDVDPALGSFLNVNEWDEYQAATK